MEAEKNSRLHLLAVDQWLLSYSKDLLVPAKLNSHQIPSHMHPTGPPKYREVCLTKLWV